MKNVYRIVVPVNDSVHEYFVPGPIIHVATRELLYLEFWYEHDDQIRAQMMRKFRTIGTGHAIPENGKHIGTAITPNGQFVWHLYEIT